MCEGKLSESELARVRPKAKTWGPECLVEGAEHTVWDITGDRPTPVDFTVKASNHLKLGEWHKRYRN